MSLVPRIATKERIAVRRRESVLHSFATIIEIVAKDWFIRA